MQIDALALMAKGIDTGDMLTTYVEGAKKFNEAGKVGREGEAAMLKIYAMCKQGQ